MVRGREARMLPPLLAGLCSALACAGLPLEPALVLPPVTLLVLEPGETCAWTEVTLGGGAVRLAETTSCPEELWLSDDGRRAVALGDGTVWHGELDSLTAVAAPPEARVVWPVGGRPVLGQADRVESRLVTWGLQGEIFEQTDSRVLTAGDWMGDPLAEHPDQSADWHPLVSRDVAVSAAALVESTPELRALTGGRGDEVGQLELGGSVLTFPVVLGDAYHVTPPVLWCASAECTVPKQLSGELPGQLRLVPKASVVLVTEEHTALSPAVYVEGRPEPVYVGPAGSRAMWLP